MNNLFKNIFEIGASEFSVSENIIIDYILVGVILFVAFKVAYVLVGDLFDLGIIHSRAAGSFAHWSIRFIIACILVEFISIILS